MRHGHGKRQQHPFSVSSARRHGRAAGEVGAVLRDHRGNVLRLTSFAPCVPARPLGTLGARTRTPRYSASVLERCGPRDVGASLGIPALTAHRALFSDGPLQGKIVLIAGGAGAVGHFAIELARRAGARVLTTVSAPEKAELARAAGADTVVDYRAEDAALAVRAAAPDGVDHIVEVALGANLELDLRVLAPNGIVVSYAETGPDPAIPIRRLLSRNLTLRFMLIYTVPPAALRTAVAEVNAAVTAGDLTELPVIRYGLDQIAEAHRAVEGGATGKVVVEL